MDADGLWVIFSTMGEMNLSEILNECQKEGWAPILIVRKQDGTVLIPCFTSQSVAIQFARRNLSKDHLWGTAKFPPEDVERMKTEWVEGKGWKLELLDHPRRMTNLGQLDIEVHSYVEKPDIYGLTGRDVMYKKPISILSEN